MWWICSCGNALCSAYTAPWCLASLDEPYSPGVVKWMVVTSLVFLFSRLPSVTVHLNRCAPDGNCSSVESIA